MHESYLPPHEGTPSPNRTLDTQVTSRLREAMVADITTRYAIRPPAILTALRTVPRHLFLPGIALDRAYNDDAIVTKHDADGLPTSSASQPAIVAIMLDQLEAMPGMRVLEIGAGTGYNAALLAEIVGPQGHVTTVDLDADVSAAARQHLEAAGYGPDRVTVICGDGAYGWAEDAPYDRIILTVGAWDVLPHWFAQLIDGGRIVVPLAIHTVQISAALERHDQTLSSTTLQPCGFMRLRGPFAGPEILAPLPETTSIRLLAEPPIPDSARVAALFKTTPRKRALTDTHGAALRIVLAFMSTEVVSLLSHPPHPLLGYHATGILTPDGDAACVLAGESGSDQLALLEYGTSNAAQHFEQVVGEWRAIGSPSLSQWSMQLYPKGTMPPPQQPAFSLVPKEHWDILLSHA
ncbi:MAG TPA: methyltransferase domain-containing protein [Ktedonobacterales bacterium]|nr:methyltransferase domain-containing protein [Ktedonobacterales bacterium]